MLVGFFELDDTAFGTLTTEDTPDATPVFYVHDVNEDNIVSSNGTCTLFDSGNLTNSYRWSFTVDNNYARGQVYSVTVRYEISAVVKQQHFTVNVV